MNSPQEQQAEYILEQSFEALTRDGVRSFTVDSLSRKLGMSKKTIYKFFPTKEDLVDKSVGFFLELIEKKLKRLIATEPNPVIQFVKVMEFIMGHVSNISIERLADLKSRFPRVWKKMESFRLARRDDFHEILSKAQKQGFVREDVDIQIISTLYMNIINSTFQPEFFLKNNLTPSDTIHNFLKMVTGGLFTEDGIKYTNELFNCDKE
ncbi:MAG: TetR/AcrR family transcriptional regulator [Candidatus Marinimicrobia bacterium]|jgi:AcrR family transcriptional regulator|nr:TetR/AcrR family transcriptional regulator [Candidatus Neomarinimicrobiota bacterium]MBT3618741.1 TetR/AcrR family transcriptional regulator [Candidatus Neomarinimicrobiota bacterium]MBT3828308.1 TetR/AcrR family transcriptional regulator [Candidatus Neomarinimicrobiota bacterium]MBT3997231.1 TetR/AcrR family transcriptional regulator [Candidatus Neomarinimicrobiota bacterium]MBT4280171.1 TetR/AcrR family transcriptional regulator [Candidatus Neomarinimicrobiota bacterium]